ncbi:MAG: hypothetical protein U0169_06780 [Polyangiaceae bacterium]
MATLNVRERRIEAKIVYVGAGTEGPCTNFRQLEERGSDGGLRARAVGEEEKDDLLALAWKPTTHGRFRDCDVVVEVVTRKSAATDDGVTRLLEDADGVVVVLEADAGAKDVNHACVAAVRKVLAERDRTPGPRRKIPVVVQVNGTGRADALPAADVLDQADATGLPNVAAAAEGGVGVFETLETALNEVLEAMLTEPNPRDVPDTNGILEQRASKEDGGHPLLDALRQVLRDTVKDHVDAIAKALSSRFDEALARESARQADEVTKKLESLRDEMKSEMVRALDARVRLDREHFASETKSLKKSFDALASEVKSTDLRPRVGEVSDRMAVVARHSETLTEHVQATSETMKAVTPKLGQLEASMKRIATVEDALKNLVNELNSAFTSTDEKTAALHSRVNEMLEEMKKPKKGWFA